MSARISTRSSTLLPRLLPLLLAAVFSQAHAAIDTIDCAAVPTPIDPAAMQQAGARLAAARAQPGEHQLALADALADLALVSARHSWALNIGVGGNPAPTELLRESMAIWNAVPPSPALAQALQARGMDFVASKQCVLGEVVLATALRQSNAAAGPNAPASAAIARDLLRVGLTHHDDVVVRRLAPDAIAALDARTQALDAQDMQVVLALIDFFYGKPGADQQDLRQAEHLVQRALTLTLSASAEARQVLSYRLVSIYYAQLRYADAEALRSKLASAQPDRLAHEDEFTRQRAQLVALVRKNDLQAALRLARSLQDQYRQAYDVDHPLADKAFADLVKAEDALRQARAQGQPDSASQTAMMDRLNRVRSETGERASESGRHLAQVRSYLGEILQAMGDLDGAAGAYAAALPVLGSPSSIDWDDRTRIRSDLAILYRSRGDYAHALPLQQQVLDELLPLLGENHPDVQEARAELALLHKLQQG